MTNVQATASSIPKRAGLKLPLLAFFLQGSWTLAVNWSAGLQGAIVSAFAQGSVSAISTYVMTVIMLKAFHHISNAPTAAISAAISSAGIMFIVLITMHNSIGTAHVGKTLILPGLAITLYAIAYSYRLYRLRQKQA